VDLLLLYEVVLVLEVLELLPKFMGVLLVLIDLRLKLGEFRLAQIHEAGLLRQLFTQSLQSFLIKIIFSLQFALLIASGLVLVRDLFELVIEGLELEVLLLLGGGLVFELPLQTLDLVLVVLSLDHELLDLLLGVLDVSLEFLHFPG
jgi:hypothetical protein